MKGEIKAYIAVVAGFVAEMADNVFHFIPKEGNIYVILVVGWGLMFLLVKEAVEDVLEEKGEHRPRIDIDN